MKSYRSDTEIAIALTKLRDPGHWLGGYNYSWPITLDDLLECPNISPRDALWMITKRVVKHEVNNRSGWLADVTKNPGNIKYATVIDKIYIWQVPDNVEFWKIGSYLELMGYDYSELDHINTGDVVHHLNMLMRRFIGNNMDTIRDMIIQIKNARNSRQ